MMKFRPKTQEWAFLGMKIFCDETQQYVYQKIHMEKCKPGKKIILKNIDPSQSYGQKTDKNSSFAKKKP